MFIFTLIINPNSNIHRFILKTNLHTILYSHIRFNSFIFILQFTFTQLIP